MYEDGDENEQSVSQQSSQNDSIRRELNKMPTDESGESEESGSKRVFTEMGKNAVDFFKGLIKIFLKLPLALKLIVLLIILLIFLSIAQKVVTERSKTDVYQKANSTVSEMKVKLNDTSLSTEEKQKLKNAVDYYEKQNSFIYFTIEDINKMYDSYKEEFEYSTGDASSPTYESLSRVHGTTNVALARQNQRIVRVTDEVELYKHMLFTEKYNFNSVNWKWFGHAHSNSGDDIRITQMAKDYDLGLAYPNDSDVKRR